MSMRDISKLISEMNGMISEIDNYVPKGAPKNDHFRAELSGLLIVSLAATYENCVKEIIIEHAEKYHPAFGQYAEKQYDKLNSRVSLSDLNGYANKLGHDLNRKFNHELFKAEKRINPNPPITDNGPKYHKFMIVKSYHRLLDCRHAFAHSRQKTTTIEEATEMNRIGRFVLLCFARALC